MSTNALELLEPSDTVQKRAQWGAFTFAVDEDGVVTVTNASYGDDAADHVYTVRISADTGAPMACTCPHYTYCGATCKHMTAVALNGHVLAAAIPGEAGSAVATDGGHVDLRNDTADAGDPETCPHGHAWCPGPTGDDLPCWPCYRAADRDAVGP